jgi:hypothetical protein
MDSFEEGTEVAGPIAPHIHHSMLTICFSQYTACRLTPKYAEKLGPGANCVGWTAKHWRELQETEIDDQPLINILLST